MNKTREEAGDKLEEVQCHCFREKKKKLQHIDFAGVHANSFGSPLNWWPKLATAQKINQWKMQTCRTIPPLFSCSLSIVVNPSIISTLVCLTTLNYKERVPLEAPVFSRGCVPLSNGSAKLRLGSAGPLMVCWSVRAHYFENPCHCHCPSSAPHFSFSNEKCVFTPSHDY